MLKVKNIKAAYQDRLVLEDISFEVAEGEFLGIIGPNGAGKTTLFKVITGIKAPLHGEIMLDEKNLKSLARKEIARIMAVVPQSSFIPPLWTVEDVVLMGRYPHQKTRFATTEEDMTALEKAMEKTNTTGFRERLVSELSGGEKQMVIIARALAQEPKILLLDEPTANLDIKHEMDILKLVKTLVKEDKMTAIMIIHDLNLASRFCDRLILLHNHKIYSQGRIEDVLSPQNLKEAYEVEAMVECNTTISALQVIVK